MANNKPLTISDFRSHMEDILNAVCFNQPMHEWTTHVEGMVVDACPECEGKDGSHFGVCSMVEYMETATGPPGTTGPASCVMFLGAAAEARIAALPSRRKPAVSVLADLDMMDW